MAVNIHSPVQVYVYEITRNFFMPIRNTLCDTIVARDKQCLRTVSWLKKNAEIPALAVIQKIDNINVTPEFSEIE